MSIEMWAGIEATINRIDNTYYEQLHKNGHKYRLSDLDLIVETGVKALRYPVLMEQLAPDDPANPDFTWTDERLPYLYDKGVRVIAGLLHHGSGPRYTNLLDEEFPEKVALYARAVSRKYPWLDMWTPINEALTTARFSALYGLWYPHETNDASFIKALFNQLKAVILAMREIRKINPKAKLVQTEDIGRTFPLQKELKYQAYFENSRRWLTFDLLTGRVNPEHPLWYYLICNADEEDILWFQDNPMPPDILGVNYYVTSERALDNRLDLYPKEMVGGNGKDYYIDVELVRIGEMLGFSHILQNVWNRYNLPIAITEAHLNCSIDEQCRWLKHAWDSAVEARKDGVDVQAVTSWAMFGSFDWNSLLVKQVNYYENGIFDVLKGSPQKTLLFDMVKSLASKGNFRHEYFLQEGWWRRPDRIIYPPTTNNMEQI